MATTPTKPNEATAEVKPAVCGHVNAHFTGDGVQSCTRELGHLGNHSAPYVNAGGRKEIVQWKDEAGTPVPTEA